MTPRLVSLPAVEAWVVRGRSWWDARAPRERVLLSGLLAVLVLAVLVQLVWRPVLEARREARQDIALYDRLAVQLRAAGPDLQAPTGVVRTGSVQSVVTATAAEAPCRSARSNSRAPSPS